MNNMIDINKLPLTNISLFIGDDTHGYFTYHEHLLVKEGFMNGWVNDSTIHYYLFKYPFDELETEGIEIVWNGNPFDLNSEQHFNK